MVTIMSDMHLAVNAYDCLTQVFVTVSVLDLDEPEDSFHRRIGFSSTFAGEGNSSLSDWAKDALVAALELL